MTDPRDDLWANVLEHWDDDAAHASFIAYCQASKRLGSAAEKYRPIALGDEAYRSQAGRAEAAKKRLAAIATLAVMDLQATATPADAARRPLRWITAAAALCCLGAVLLLFTQCG